MTVRRREKEEIERERGWVSVLKLAGDRRVEEKKKACVLWREREREREREMACRIRAGEGEV